MSTPNIDINRISDDIQSTAFSRFEQLTHRKIQSSESSSSMDSLFEPLQCLILVAGQRVRITFKVFFKLSTAQFLAAPFYRCDPGAIETSQALDFIREFCNITAAGVKKDIVEAKIELGTSLPIIMKGFDDVFFAKEKGSGQIRYWRINFENSHHLIMASFVEVFGPAAHLLSKSGAAK